jgi:LCP family protein required for cell wall assembly
MRGQQSRRKKILAGVGIALASILAVAVIGVIAFMLIINNKLGTNLQGNQMDFASGVYEGVFTEPEKPEDPFWLLLMGTDDRDGFEIPRTDTLILARVDQQNKAVAMVSIPRDTYVTIEGVGNEKINTAYTYAEVEEPGSGPAATVKAVSQFAGVDIAYFAQVNFDGLVQLVDDLGGVEVEVPVDIIGDINAGGLDIYAGLQILDGPHALVFCRSRNFPNGDYQRQADQRTLLQALAAKVLASDPATIATTVGNLANMTYTNMDVTKIAKIAQSMRGMGENGIHTYTVPSAPDWINGVSYVIADTTEWEELIAALERGEYPERQDEDLGGIVPESYVANAGAATAGGASAQGTAINPRDYAVDVYNGCGITGAAASVSETLVVAGYRRGETGDARNNAYAETLIIYQNETDRAAANAVKQQLGYGNVLASQGDYTFKGNILVVVGQDFGG